MSQSTDVPTGQGFAKSLKLDCTTADASPASADQLKIQIKLEGQNLQFLKKGTSSAVSTTLSFWVRSYKTGTYIARLEDTDNSRNISKSYTISSADTWEKKEITFAGDTTGTLTNDFNNSLVVELILGAGSDFTSGTLNTSWNSTTNANVAVGQVNLADNTANDFYVTGIQLEAGTSASDFEFLPHTVNLKRCQRYCEKIDKSTTESVICLGQGTGGSSVFGRVYFETAKRVVPSGTISAASDIQVLTGSASAWSTASGASVQAGDERTMRLALTGLSGMTTGGCHEVRINASDGSIIYDAEI